MRFWNGARYSATLVGTDASTDLAVIKVNAPASVLHPLQLGSSSDVQVGQPVVAIGSPYGLEETVTSGIVSALHREMTAPNNFTIADSIQTDAAINHGNSGGPLLDLNGRVIGVNAQIKSETGENTGVGFAIPSDTVRSIASRLATGATVQHAYLGVSIATAANGSGVVLNEIRPGTPAEKAGLQHRRRDRPHQRPEGDRLGRARPGDRRQAARRHDHPDLHAERLDAHDARHARHAAELAAIRPLHAKRPHGGRFALHSSLCSAAPASSPLLFASFFSSFFFFRASFVSATWTFASV